MPLQGVIFDMGGTLVHYTPPGQTWEEVERRGALSVYNYLLEQKHTLPAQTEAIDLAWNYARSLWSSLDQYDVKDLKLGLQMKLLAQQWGISEVSPEVSEALALAYMAELQAEVTPLEGVAETLQALDERGLKLGLVSNTMWPGAHHLQDLERYHLTGYFDHLLFSADEESWKPNPDVFERSLKALGLQPGEAAFVGDSLYFDMYGAKRVGMKTIWIEQVQPWLPEGLDVTPDATIKRLPDLIPIIDAWREA